MAVLCLAAACHRAPPTTPPAITTAMPAAVKQAVPSTAPKAKPPAQKPPEKSVDPSTAIAAAASAEPVELASEKLVLFLPGGPLVVELQMTIDGQPFRAAREELVDEALKLADGDHDGESQWEEIYTDPKHAFTQRFGLQTKNMNRKEFLKTNDTNQNGLMDRDEARRIVARAKGAGAAFSLSSSSEYRHVNQRQSIVRTMLDANGDDILDEAELETAADRLLGRDANDDHTVTWSELDDSLAGDAQDMTARQNAYLNQPAAFVLGPRADWDGIVYALSDLYLSGDQISEGDFPLVNTLAGELDADGDGHLTYDEVRRLDVIDPHLLIAANFGKTGDLLASLSLLRVSAELGAADRIVTHSPRGLTLRLGDYQLRIVLDDRAPAGGEPSPETQLESLDKDKNGYLDKDEIAESSPDAVKMFDDADANADGKLYLDELAAYRRRQQPPQFSAIQAVARDDQDVLFPLLDVNQDGRLTTRELRGARGRLLALDGDGDGRLSLEELPGGLTLWLGHGLPPEASTRPSSLAAMSAPAEPTGPSWFTHLDVNRDQEISLEEFPGSRNKFRSLDLDGDGFVSASEAQAAAR
jgi:Ca2+-binding EF-hand superfamily protein